MSKEIKPRIWRHCLVTNPETPRPIWLLERFYSYTKHLELIIFSRTAFKKGGGELPSYPLSAEKDNFSCSYPMGHLATHVGQLTLHSWHHTTHKHSTRDGIDVKCIMCHLREICLWSKVSHMCIMMKLIKMNIKNLTIISNRIIYVDLPPDCTWLKIQTRAIKFKY